MLDTLLITTLTLVDLLISRASDTDVGKDGGKVKCDNVLATPEGHQRHCDDNEQPMQVVPPSEKRSPSNALLCGLHRVYNLCDLRGDERIIRVSASMIFGNDALCLFDSADRREPSRALGQPVNGRKHKARNGGLERGRDSPIPSVGWIHVRGAEACPSDDDASKIPAPQLAT